MDPSNNHPNPPSRPQRGRGGKTSTPTTPKTPSKRRVKSPPPQETPSRLREHITMRPNADTSILGSRMIKANAPMEQDPNATQTGDSAPTSTSPLTIRVQAPSPLAAASNQRPHRPHLCYSITISLPSTIIRARITPFFLSPCSSLCVYTGWLSGLTRSTKIPRRFILNHPLTPNPLSRTINHY